jgi:3-hydroxyisobutyrate dehydrogenase-like beta-hydroxyacid dehydrogenase
MKKIAWIGTGVMGHAMVSHLISAGYPVTVYTRTKAKAFDLTGKATVVDSIAEAVKDADVVISIVGYPADVESVYTTVFEHAKPHTLCIDMTTSSPQLAKTLAERAKAAGMRMMDAPVSGGDLGARNATLTIMVGSEPADYEEALPLFKIMGKTITYIGPAGSGQHCKMANQVVIAGTIAAVAEGLTYLQRVGLDPHIALGAIGGGSASSWQLLNNGPKMLNGDFAPGFYLHHFVKDLTLATSEAQQVDLTLPITQQVLDLYTQLLEEGDRDLGTQAIIKAYQKGS